MSNRARRRLDHELVRRGLVATRQQASAAVADGRVLVAGAPADKPARLVSPAEAVVVRGASPRFVGRGGEKLDGALEAFGIVVAGRQALDAGASTGGFTDCLLQRGAAHVHAVDVGHGQLDARLRADRRVSVHERVNVRWLTPARLRVPTDATPLVDLVVADLSFISLAVVAPVLAGPLLRPGGDLVVLVKPQFEVGRATVSRGRGVVRDPAAWREALVKVTSALGAAGAGIMGAMTSPLLGSAGNTEFFLHALAGSGPSDGPAVQGWIDAAVRHAADAPPA